MTTTHSESTSPDPLVWSSTDGFGAAAERLRAASSAAVVSHVRPDGDAIGSVLALGRTLELLGARVGYFNPDGCPNSFRFMPGADRVAADQPDPLEYELVISVDTAAADRMGAIGRRLFDQAGSTMVIDHHVSNPGYADANLILPDHAATGQILFDLITSQRLPVDTIVNTALYVAIMTDTGGFRFQNTSAEVLQAAASLVAAGVDAGDVADHLYARTPMRQAQVIARCVDGLRSDLGGRIVSWGLSLDLKRQLGLVDDDSEGISEFLRSLDGVEAAVFFEELENGMVRVSARSRNPAIDVCAVCRQFNGGGHTLAAGARIAGDLDHAMSSFLAALAQHAQPQATSNAAADSDAESIPSR